MTSAPPMVESIDTLIAMAIDTYTTEQIGSGPQARAFVRLEGFSSETYRSLLSQLATKQWQLAGRRLMVRSIDPIAGFPEQQMEADRSATWYRNHLPANQTLLLILNRRTSDAQSLQDLFAISEQTLTRDGLNHLIGACFRAYQLNQHQRQLLHTFVARLRRNRIEPQLRDLAECFQRIETLLKDHPGIAIEDALVRSLPAINLFRCNELAKLLNTPRGDKLIQQIKKAVQISSDALEERELHEYLERLEHATLADDSSFGGLSSQQKKDLLREFIEGQLDDQRARFLQALDIDWSEIQLVISSRSQTTKAEKYTKIAEQLEQIANHTPSRDRDVASALHEVLEQLQQQRDPEAEALSQVLNEYAVSLPKKLHNDLKRMVRPRTRRNADFLVGLVSLLSELTAQHRRQEDAAPSQISVRITTAFPSEKQADYQREQLAAHAFQILYGGIERIFPSIVWQLAPLWQVAEQYTNQHETSSTTQPDEDTNLEHERVVRSDLIFHVSYGNERADLIWQYRSDSPAGATTEALEHARQQLEQADLGTPAAAPGATLAIPIYNNCKVDDDIGDIDISRPLHSFGTWYDQPASLRDMLQHYFQPHARPQTWQTIEPRLSALELAWAAFVRMSQQGLLAADITPLLYAYETLLETIIHTCTVGAEFKYVYRLVNQAWVIGNKSFERWVVLPLIHPLKLLWWSERARFFNTLISNLQQPDSVIVDEKRFQQELATSYGSSGFPAILALSPSPTKPAAYFLPIEESEGYELYFHQDRQAEAHGLDTDLLAEDENELAALRAVEGIVTIVQDYIETYPFARDGIEIFLFECRNGALPGMLVEQLGKASQKYGWSVQLTIVVHTSSHGAPLFRRVSTWVNNGYPGVERQGSAYFPKISIKVLECSPEELFDQQEDTDIVVLADVLLKRGQEIECEVEEPLHDDLPLAGFLPTNRSTQEPFTRYEQSRNIRLNHPDQPKLVRLFLLAQAAAKKEKSYKSNREACFIHKFSLGHWQEEIERLHNHFNWVICYDPTIDRFLLQETFPNKVQVIRYSLGLGTKRQHNLTVSSAGRSQEIVMRRLANRLIQMFPQATFDQCKPIAQQLISEAKVVSGDIVLRAAGPGAFLNELIGLVVAKFETERTYRTKNPESLATWILLDDFEHWLKGGKFPDLLFVAIERRTTNRLSLHMQVIEAKCINQLAFATEASDAEIQVRRGIKHLHAAFQPGNQHLDALYWYDQLYRAIAGNLDIDTTQQDLWELFRENLHRGNFDLEISGHTWIFCHDGQAGVGDHPIVQEFAPSRGEADTLTMRSHHYGRNQLAKLLHDLTTQRTNHVLPEQMFAQPSPVAEPEAQITNIPEPVVIADPEPLPSAAPPQADLPVQPNETLAESIPAIPAANPAILTSGQSIDSAWLNNRAHDLERALRQRNIQIYPIQPTDADIGPSVVRFKLRLRPTETLKRLQGVAEDLSRDLALASTPIIDNVQRTNFVGVDIPRERADTIALLPLLQQLRPPATAALPIIIGSAPDGSVVIEDLSEFPHLLVAGATNSGKSVFLRSLLLSLMTQYPVGKLELLIVDPKRTDFTFFNRTPYLRGGQVIIEAKEARDALLELVRQEMPRRQNVIANRSMKIKDFNRRFPEEALPPIVALIDEYALLVSIMEKKERESFEQDLMILAAAARSVGIHLVLATQRPSADIVTSTLKANLDARIAFRVASNTNSRVVLDTTGAENLLGRGDLLFRRSSGELIRLQAPFMDEEAMDHYLSSLSS